MIFLINEQIQLKITLQRHNVYDTSWSCQRKKNSHTEVQL